jgi:hypothetical protein
MLVTITTVDSIIMRKVAHVARPLGCILEVPSSLLDGEISWFWIDDDLSIVMVTHNWMKDGRTILNDKSWTNDLLTLRFSWPLSDVNVHLSGFRRIVCWSCFNISTGSAVIFITMKIPTVIYILKCWNSFNNANLTAETSVSNKMVGTILQQREGDANGG